MIAPVIASGNACVVVAAEADPCVAIAFAEVLATSDLPGGVINILTGNAAELAPHLAAHADVNALDLTGAEPDLRTPLEQAAAETVKRVYVPRGTPDFAAAPAWPGCGRSWRSRPSGIRPARCRCPAALVLSARTEAGWRRAVLVAMIGCSSPMATPPEPPVPEPGSFRRADHNAVPSAPTPGPPARDPGGSGRRSRPNPTRSLGQ